MAILGAIIIRTFGRWDWKRCNGCCFYPRQARLRPAGANAVSHGHRTDAARNFSLGGHTILGASANDTADGKIGENASRLHLDALLLGRRGFSPRNTNVFLCDVLRRIWLAFPPCTVVVAIKNRRFERLHIESQYNGTEHSILIVSNTVGSTGLELQKGNFRPKSLMLDPPRA